MAVWWERRDWSHIVHLWAWDRLSLSYLVVILQHLSDDSYLWMIVLYGDHSEKERTEVEAGFALPLESDGKINLIISEMSGWAILRGCRHWTKLNCVSTPVPHGSMKKKPQNSHRLCPGHKRRVSWFWYVTCVYRRWGTLKQGSGLFAYTSVFIKEASAFMGPSEVCNLIYPVDEPRKNLLWVHFSKLTTWGKQQWQIKQAAWHMILIVTHVTTHRNNF